MTEKWAYIPGWGRLYEASTEGRIRSRDRKVGARDGGEALRRGRILVPVAKGGRYLAVTLADGVRREQCFVHDLVMLTFRGPKPEGAQVCHWDDDKANNVLSNLRYGTAQDNSDDKHRNGYSGKGERHPGARLTAEDVIAIRRSDEPGTVLAHRFGVHPGHISSIRNRKTWKHI